MKHRARVNLWLLAALAGGAWLVWHELREPVEAPRVERVTELAPAEVRRLSIVREADGRVLEFLRASGRWWLMRDSRLPADAVRVGEVLRLAAAASETSYELADVDLREVGLDPPRARVVIDGNELRIGAQAPLNYRRYVASKGRLYLVADTAYVHLGADWPAFVDPSPLAGLPEPSAVSAPGWNAERREDGLWHVGDDARAAGYATAWTALVADLVRERQLPATAEPVALQFTFADGSKRKLLAWSRDGRWWVAWNDGPVQYAVPAGRVDDLGLD